MTSAPLRLLALFLATALACGGPDDVNQTDPDPDPVDLTVFFPSLDATYVLGPDDVLSPSVSCSPTGCVLACSLAFLGLHGDTPGNTILLASCSEPLPLTEEGVWRFSATATHPDDPDARASLDDEFTVLFAFTAGLEQLTDGDTLAFSYPLELSPFCSRTDCTHTCTYARDDDDDLVDVGCTDLNDLFAFTDTDLTLETCAGDPALAHCQTTSYTFTYTEPAWTHLSAGGSHTCGILEDGSLWCWGAGENGQLGTGSNTPYDEPVHVAPGTFWESVSAGGAHTCGIQAGGSCIVGGTPAMDGWGTTRTIRCRI